MALCSGAILYTNTSKNQDLPGLSDVYSRSYFLPYSSTPEPCLQQDRSSLGARGSRLDNRRHSEVRLKRGPHVISALLQRPKQRPFALCLQCLTAHVHRRSEVRVTRFARTLPPTRSLQPRGARLAPRQS